PTDRPFMAPIDSWRIAWPPGDRVAGRPAGGATDRDRTRSRPFHRAPASPQLARERQESRLPPRSRAPVVQSLLRWTAVGGDGGASAGPVDPPTSPPPSAVPDRRRRRVYSGRDRRCKFNRDRVASIGAFA